jgi:hypothetical protein
MFFDGFFTGMSLAVVQNGRESLLKLGVPHPEVIIFSLQSILTLIIPGFRWKASEHFHTLTRHAPPILGELLQKEIEGSNTSLEAKATNVQKLIKSIVDGYLASATDERFKANFNGIISGLSLGNLMLGKPFEAAFYLASSLILSKIVTEKYEKTSGGIIDKVSHVLNEMSLKERKERIEREIDGQSPIATWEYLKNLDLERRELALTKNTSQDFLTKFILISTAAINFYINSGGKNYSIADLLYPSSYLATTLMERLVQISSRKTTEVEGKNALHFLTEAIEELISLDERKKAVRDQEIIFDSHGNPVIKKINIMPYPDKSSGKIRDEIEFNEPVTINGGQMYLVYGGIKTGKTTFLNTLAELKISKERDLFIRIPIENQSQFDIRTNMLILVNKNKKRIFDMGINQKDIDNLKNGRDIKNNKIVINFVKYCRENHILEGENGISPEWFESSGRIFSGSEQLFLNTTMYFWTSASDSRRIFLFDAPNDVLDDRGKDKFFYFVKNHLSQNKNHSMIFTSNDLSFFYLLGDDFKQIIDKGINMDTLTVKDYEELKETAIFDNYFFRLENALKLDSHLDLEQYLRKLNYESIPLIKEFMREVLEIHLPILRKAIMRLFKFDDLKSYEQIKLDYLDHIGIFYLFIDVFFNTYGLKINFYHLRMYSVRNGYDKKRIDDLLVDLVFEYPQIEEFYNKYVRDHISDNERKYFMKIFILSKVKNGETNEVDQDEYSYLNNNLVIALLSDRPELIFRYNSNIYYALGNIDFDLLYKLISNSKFPKERLRKFFFNPDDKNFNLETISHNLEKEKRELEKELSEKYFHSDAYSLLQNIVYVLSKIKKLLDIS